MVKPAARPGQIFRHGTGNEIAEKTDWLRLAFAFTVASRRAVDLPISIYIIVEDLVYRYGTDNAIVGLWRANNNRIYLSDGTDMPARYDIAGVREYSIAVA